MKKRVVMLIILITTILIFCSGCSEGVADEEFITYENNYGEDDQGFVEYVVERVNASRRTNREYLEDLDYLLATLQDNFPLFNATYRKHSVSIHELFEDARTFIEQRNVIHDQAFMHILETQIFQPIVWMGHLSTMHPFQYRMNMEFIESNPESAYDSFGSVQFKALTNPTTVAFYNELPYTGQLLPYNLSTGIIEDNTIAYINLYWMVSLSMNTSEWMESRQTLFDFYYEIQDFQHLIIDIRGNGGGCRGFFPHLIMGPNITEPLSASFYWFINADERSFQRFQEEFVEWRNLSLEPISSEVIVNMPYLHEEDLEGFDYFILYQFRASPIEWNRRFNGKMWLLIDEWTASAADSATLISQQTGFATVVGQPTMGGVASISPVFFALPNTGILVRYVSIYTTDLYGRNNYEHGTSPDIFNRPGLDAMETVLELIHEGEY